MHSWTTSDAEQLTEVHLGSGAASTVAWCPVNGLLAVGARRHAKMACVYVISPHCLEHKVTLAVPLQGPEDGLVCVTWSPAGCRRVLLTATRSGAVAAWTQQPPGRNSKQTDMQSSPVVTINDWWCHSVGQLVPQQHSTPAAAGQQQPDQESLLSMQWLHPPSCWPYNNRVLQEHDFQAGSVPNMFAPPAAKSRPVKPEAGLQADADGDIHWVQPGTLAFAAVLSSGRAAVGWATWGAHGQLRWQVTPSFTLLPAGPGVLLAADATWSVGGIAVALATQQEPDKVQVLELQGNPLHHHCLAPGLPGLQPALQVQPLAATSIAAGAPASVLSLSWDAHSSGQKLAVATHSSSSNSSSSGPGHVTLLSLAAQQGGPGVPPYSLAAVTAAQVAQAPQPQQYAWLLDGLLVGQQLLDAATLVPLPLKFPQSKPGGVLQQQQHGGQPAPPALQALAPSPHRVAVAMVQSASSPEQHPSSCRLLLYSVPPVSKAAAGGELAPTLAGRLVWSLLLQRHSWDMVQHLLHAAQPQPKVAPPAAGGAPSSTSAQDSAAAGQAAEVQAQRVGQVLGLVDNKLCVQADEVYTMYAARWDALKYAVVSHTPGSEARAFSIDLRLRLLVALFEQHISAAVREEELRQGQAQQHPSSSGAGPAVPHQLGGAAATIATLAELALAVVDFEVCCVATWLHRRAAAEAAAASAGGDAAAVAASEASVRAVPCIRNMLDMRSNSKLATVWTKASDLVKLSKVSRAFSAWKLLHKPVTGQAEPPQNWEDLLPGVVPGPFQLHPSSQTRNFPVCLLNFKLPAEQLLRHLHSVADWQQLPVLTDADITARATRLGLLPAKTLEAKALYSRQVLLHSSFRQDLPHASLSDPAAAVKPAGAAAGKRAPAHAAAAEELSSAAAKRRRWEAQVQDCMGSTSGVSTVCSAQVVDVVHMAWASPSALRLHSVDGSVLCREESGQVQGGGDARSAGRRPGPSSLHTWAYVCPITGQMWMPAHV